MMRSRQEDVILSAQALSVWGKSDWGKNESWLPLFVHMYDSLSVADFLWEHWIPQGTRDIVSRGVGGDESLARILYQFLAGVHDVGKATPIFQAQPYGFNSADSEGLVWKPRNAGLPIKPVLEKRQIGVFRVTHPLAGEVILNNYFCETFGWSKDVANTYSCIVGGHHGIPPMGSGLRKVSEENPDALGWDGKCGASWRNVQTELVEFVSGFVGLDKTRVGALQNCNFPPMAQSILTGLVIMADWIASNTDYFPLLPLIPENDGQKIEINGHLNMSLLHVRVKQGWDNLSLTPSWNFSADSTPSSIDDLYGKRFSFARGSVRPVQKHAAELAWENPDPGLMVIEAPMGEGKTEAALAAAEILARKTGRGGVCVALPTMATTDAMFGRVHNWLSVLPQTGRENDKSVYLAHGKAQLNEEFQGIARWGVGAPTSNVGIDLSDSDAKKVHNDDNESVVVNEWMRGRKKGVLANFLVCTVDQVLMGALDMKHLALRQLSFANKVVIIDECHAYDVYMQQYLLRILEWLGSMGSPVILLSATLPEQLRQEMVDAYITGKKVMQGIIRPDSNSGSPRSRKPKHFKKPGGDSSASCLGDNADSIQTVRSLPVGSEDYGAYPLITYTSGIETSSLPVEPSGRSADVKISLMEDDDDTLIRLLRDSLSEGGCAGVICDTVSRAQHVCEVLQQVFDSDSIILSHARFIDVDRMSNETRLRSILGPKATLANGERPELSIVVGTQVLEQSLDIDFDVLVTDIAPVDLLMQRLGRLHRHRRGEGESDRPQKLRQPVCYVRGIDSWKDGCPEFSKGVGTVYFPATLLETLTVLGLSENGDSKLVHLPDDIAKSVRLAYHSSIKNYVPPQWSETYDTEVKSRENECEVKKKRAENYLLKSVGDMCRSCLHSSLVSWFEMYIKDSSRDEDQGQRAVRDTQESVEVMLLVRDGDSIRLLPWVEQEYVGSGCSEEIPTDQQPEDSMAKIMAQCVVRLPLSMTPPCKIDSLIGNIEDECGEETSMWQESPWIKGSLVLFLTPDEDFQTFSIDIHGHTVSYSRGSGLSAVKQCSTDV